VRGRREFAPIRAARKGFSRHFGAAMRGINAVYLVCWREFCVFSPRHRNFCKKKAAQGSIDIAGVNFMSYQEAEAPKKLNGAAYWR
jgi:hypothetical protein